MRDNGNSSDESDNGEDTKEWSGSWHFKGCIHSNCWIGYGEKFKKEIMITHGGLQPEQLTVWIVGGVIYQDWEKMERGSEETTYALHMICCGHLFDIQ